MPGARTLSVLVSLVGACVLAGLFSQRPTADQAKPQPPQPTTGSSGSEFLHWPLPPADSGYSRIDGQHLWHYVKEQTDLAEHYREQGHPQFWGRIAGTSGDVEDARWLLERYKQIGLTDTRMQTVACVFPQWVPESWEVTATLGGKTTKLTSAQPPYGAVSTGGKVLDLPAAYVGLGSDADFVGRDVRGKAILFFRSTLTYNIAADVLKRAEERGAAAVFVSDLRGGNYSIQAYRANTTVPAFNLGSDDGVALRDLIAKAPAGEPPHLRIRLDARWESGQKSFLVWGTLPGATDETIYIIAHRDGWFEAAGDNASGVATMLGLAEYFARIPQHERRRTMVFLGTDGHHQIQPGGFGRVWLVANKERFFSKTALMINAEHPSEVLTHGATGGTTSGTTVPLQWYAGGTSRPRLEKIAVDAFHEFGVPVWTEPSRTPPGGDLGAFYTFVPGVVAQSNDFIHMHTTGDTAENVVWSGLEAATRSYAKIIDQVNKLAFGDLHREPEGSFTFPFDLAPCAAWVRDSSSGCTSGAR